MQCSSRDTFLFSFQIIAVHNLNLMECKSPITTIGLLVCMSFVYTICLIKHFNILIQKNNWFCNVGVEMWMSVNLNIIIISRLAAVGYQCDASLERVLLSQSVHLARHMSVLWGTVFLNKTNFMPFVFCLFYLCLFDDGFSVTQYSLKLRDHE
jgi:hypothetical protein